MDLSKQIPGRFYYFYISQGSTGIFYPVEMSSSKEIYAYRHASLTNLTRESFEASAFTDLSLCKRIKNVQEELVLCKGRFVSNEFQYEIYEKGEDE